MAREIVGLLQDADRRQALGAASAEHMRATFDWDVLAQTLLAAYGTSSAPAKEA
jgi:hypothetical protein